MDKELELKRILRAIIKKLPRCHKSFKDEEGKYYDYCRNSALHVYHTWDEVYYWCDEHIPLEDLTEDPDLFSKVDWYDELKEALNLLEDK